MIIAAMMGMVGIAVDGVVISRFLGPKCMAAYGLVTPLTNLTMVFALVFSGGAQVVCAHLVGAGRKEEARRVFSTCMTATVVLSACLMAVLFIWRGDICIMLGASGKNADLLPLASNYLLGVLLAIPSIIMLFEFNGLMRLDNNPNLIIVAVTVMTLMVISGDLLNALVIHGGMLGMGLTTSISYVTAVAIMMLHFRRKNIIFHYSPKGMKFKDLKDIIVIGSSSAVGSGSAMLRNRVLNGIMLQTAMAVAATAALSIFNTILNVTSSIMGAMGLTCSMITGLVIGMDNEDKKKELKKTTVKNALFLAIVLFVLLFIFAPYIVMLFKGPGGEKMTMLATRGLRIYSVGIFLFALNTAYINHAQGMRRMVVSNTFCFLENFVLIVIPALALSGVIETDAVWVAYPIAEAITFAFIIIFRLVSKRRSV